MNIKCMLGFHTQEVEIVKILDEDGKTYYLGTVKCRGCMKQPVTFEYVE